MNYPLVKIEWVDSFGAGASWTKFDEMDKEVELRCTSVGYLVKETDIYVIIVPHLHGRLVVLEDARELTQSGCGDMAIPKSAIVSQNILVEKDKS